MQPKDFGNHLPGEEPGEESDEKRNSEIRHAIKAKAEKKPQKILKKYRVRVCLTMCKYNVVHDLCAERNWKECSADEDYNLFWYDWSINNARLSAMKPWQKINHFPGMEELTRKDGLARNMARVKKLFPDDYNFVPPTFQLPQEMAQFQQYYQEVKKNKPIFISKPNASCQGKGIRLFKSPDQIDAADSQVIQEYQTKPYLINGYKFDLRLYVVLLQVSPYPLILFYEDGMARFCTEKYQEPHSKNMKNTYMHLTNYAVNKKNPNFQFNHGENSDNEGSKWGYSKVLEEMAKDGCNVPQFKESLNDLFIKTIFSALPQLQQQYQTYRSSMPRFAVGTDPFQSKEPYFGSSCFEILGFDILITQDFKPILLEVNHSPSFTCDTPLDLRIKETLIGNVMDMLWICQDDKILGARLDEIKSLRSLYKINTERDRQLVEEKTRKILASKAKPVPRKKMPTYASVMRHIERVVKRGPFVQIYPLQAGVEEKYVQILKALKTGVKPLHGNHSNQPPQSGSLYQQKLRPLSKQLSAISANRIKDDSYAHEKQVTSATPTQDDSTTQEPQTAREYGLVRKESFQDVPQPPQPIEPLTLLYQQIAREMEFGTQKQLQFKGVVKPVLLNQGALRSEKVEKTVDQELTNRIRAMVRIGVREMAEVVIRMGQKGGGVAPRAPLPGPPQRVDVFGGINGVRSKSNAFMITGRK